MPVVAPKVPAGHAGHAAPLPFQLRDEPPQKQMVQEREFLHVAVFAFAL
jgi:hypothetical protein